MERVRLPGAVRGWIGERIDDLHLFDDRTWPAVRDEQRERVFALRADVEEMDVEAVDLGDVVWKRVEPCFALSPVVLGGPVTGERLHRGELHSLRGVRDGLPLRPVGGADAAAQ